MKIAYKISFAFIILGFLLAGIIPWLTNKIHPLFRYTLSALLSGILGFVFCTIILRRIPMLYKGIEIACAGNYDYALPPGTKDEIGQLAKFYNTLVDQLRQATETIYELNHKSTDLIETKRDLQDREEYFRRLFEYSNDAVFIYGFDGNVIDVNRKACDMLGYSKEELLKIPFLNLQPKSELDKSKTAMKTHAKTGSVRFESVFQKKEGSIINVEISSSIVDVKKGIMQSIVSNITERKEIEKSLRESEEKFRTFMETASDLMYITNAAGDITYVNEAMARILGYSREELIGMPFHEIVDKESLEDSKKIRSKYLNEGENIHHITWETKNRKKVTGEMKVAAIYSPDGDFKGIRGVFRDITERKKIEESQRLAQLGKFAADIAHEVNNQLMVIATRSRISLMRKPQDKDLEKDLSIISGQCDHVKDIVKRLLLFSKPSRGDFKEANIHDVIDFVIQLIEHQFESHQVEIQKQFASSVPNVKIDEKHIQEVLMNLFRNAYDAMPDGGKIEVSTSQENGHIQIDIKDSGEGISEKDMKQIFDPFFTTKEHGTGLGLSVCYGVIKAHDGELTYSSTPGKGTTAHILLPISE